jgi:hypothetical protein
MPAQRVLHGDLDAVSGAIMSTRILVTGAGTAASQNLLRSIQAGARELVEVGCHSDRWRPRRRKG